MQATPQTDTVSPVTVADFAAFIGASASDPLLPGLLQAATDATIRYINQDLIVRKWILKCGDNQGERLQLSPPKQKSNIFELPYTALMRVLSVTGGCDSICWEIVSTGRPAKIRVDGWDGVSELTISYTAGMATIPAAIKTAIMMVGGFIYDHRGGCDAQDAIKKSGAMNLLRTYKVEVAL